MKVAKKLLAVALVLVLVFSLTSCTEFESKMLKAVNKMKKVNNLRADVVFTLDLDVKMLGQSLSEMEISAEGTLDIDTVHSTGFGQFHIVSVDEEQDVLFYFEKSGDVMRTWISDDDGMTWKLSETTADEAGAASGFTAWNGTDEITATTGHKLLLVVKNAESKILKAGLCTVTSKV